MEKSTVYVWFLLHLAYTKNLFFYVHLEMQSLLSIMIISGLGSEKFLGSSNKKTLN